jgi:hypothetical protein
MTSKSMAYDHPAYTVPVVFSGSTAVGANGVTTKFAAYTAMKIKAVHSGPALALVTTAAGSQPLLYSQHGTTTATSTLTVLTSASYTNISDDLGTEITLAAGDAFWYTHGTDATTSRAVAVECVLVPGANVTQ